MLTPKKPLFLPCKKKLQHNCTQKQTNFEKKKKNQISTIMGLDLRLAYPENASFLSVSDLLSSHKAQAKSIHAKRKHFPLCF
jgi:hypothetical protein